jgi:hypothetical protein
MPAAGSFDNLRIILLQEIRDLQGNLEENRCKNQDGATAAAAADDRLFSRVADRNDIIRINTLRWVLEVIENLEHNKGRC